jgi:NarL family two-component system response regulator YdfI
MPAPIRILIADDHPLIRDGLSLVLETAPDCQCAGMAADGLEAVRMAAELRPDLVLMDLRMPRLDGIGAISRILADLPGTGILVLTTFNEEELLLRALRAGARGCLLKETDRPSLLAAIRTIAAGGSVIPPALLNRLLAGPADGGEQLSQREKEVLKAAAAGARSKEIAGELGISERTVKAHLANAYAKLGSDSRAGAVAEAIRRGWL